MGKSPNLEQNFDNQDRAEGIIDGVSNPSPLSLDLEDGEILSIIGSRVSDGEAFWNKELSLDEVRKEAEKYYLGETYDENDLYDFQVPYKNNRILTAIETLIPMIVAQEPLPVVTEARDTDESRQAAHDLENVLLAKYEDLYMKQKFGMVARHLMVGYRIGILKYKFNPDGGDIGEDGEPKGKIEVDYVQPSKVVFAADSTDPDNPELIAEYLTATIEELTLKYPDKKDQIYLHFGIKRGVRSQIARKVGYVEVWFSYYDKNGEQQEAVAWKLSDKLLLKAIKNPNWNYTKFRKDEKTGKIINLNFFDRPKKPYILVNHINLGKHILDDTSLADQAHPLEDVLEKRGRQIVENADQASSGLVFNSKMISPADAAKIVGDPTEKIMVAGAVGDAATRLPYNVLPAYVINDKNDARIEIDNIFGANAAIRGEETKTDTLGVQVLSQRANSGRLQTITDAIEDAADKLYKALIQMMKVYMDEPEIERFTTADGKTQFIEWDQDKIEDGIKIRVKAGSALPKDKVALRNETVQMAAVLDPLSLAEGLDKANPKEWAKRLVYYRFFMDKYLSEILGEDGSTVDNQAIADINILGTGQMPQVPDEPSKKYLSTFERYLQSNGFQAITDPNIKNNIIQFAKQVSDKAKLGAGIKTDTTPTPPVETTPPIEGEQPPEGELPAGQSNAVPEPGKPMSENSQNILQKVVSFIRGK